VRKILVPMVILVILALVLGGCSSNVATTSAPQTTTAPTTTTAAPTVPTVSATSSTPTASTKPPTSTAAATTATTTASNKSGGTARVIIAAAPGAPLGAEWEGNIGTFPTQQIVMQKLVVQQLDNSMEPSLATSWVIDANANPPTTTFTLRKGVKFHDGTDFNAAAVKWNFEIFKSTGMFTSASNYWKSFDAVDDYTFRVNFTEARNALFITAWEYYFIVSPTAYAKNGIEYMRTHMIGTGPFKQTDYQRDVAVTTARNENYWDTGKPYLNGVNVLYVADEMTREALMKSGGAETLEATPKLAQRFQNNPDFNVLSRLAGPYSLVPDSLNADSPWSNLKVRQALEYALDRESLVKTFGYGFGEAAYQLPTPLFSGFNSALTPRKYDVAKAKQLLTDAGYPNGFKSRIVAQPGLDRDPVVAIQSYLAKVGITVDLQFPESSSWQSFLTNPWSNGLAYTQINEYPNMNTAMDVYFADPGGFYYKSTKKPDGWRDLYSKSAHTPLPDPAVFKEISAAFYNDATFCPVFYGAYAYVVSPKLKDTSILQLGNRYGWNSQNAYLTK
jgi:ABC-type transport system substrate-binding protein